MALKIRFIAFDYFKIGAPVGLEGCRRKHDSALKLQQKKAQKMIDKNKMF